MILLAVQLTLFLASRILDDLSWTDFQIYNENMIFQSVAIAFLIICALIKIARKEAYRGLAFHPVLLLAAEVHSHLVSHHHHHLHVF